MINNEKPILPGCSVLPPLEGAFPPPAAIEKPQVVAAAKRKTAGHRFQTLNAFIDVTLAGLGRSEIGVWVILWRDTKPNGLAQTSQTDLARRAGVTDRTVRRAIERLLRCGLLTVVRRGGLRKGASTYRVHPLGRESQEDTGVQL